jgi:hypothetical protein
MDGVELESIQPMLLDTFRQYVEKRIAFYSDSGRILDSLLKKDILLLALRGIHTADEFVEHAFSAFESSSEETMWGNAWQEALAKATPNTVGGGDLRTERDGTLWIIQLKLGPQNAGTQAQDIRVLKGKVDQERDHHPGRKNVKGMYAIVRGKPANEWRNHRSTVAVNRDIDGFQYQYMRGSEFLRWVGAEFAHENLVAALTAQTERVRLARESSLAAVKDALMDRLRQAGLPLDVSGVLRLSELPSRRKTRPKDQSSA